jgi:hypothetical protein
MDTDIHCPDCGASTRRERDEDGWDYAICPNDDCPMIVVQVLAAPRVTKSRVA